MKRNLQIPSSIRDAGIDEKKFLVALEAMAGQAMVDRCTPTNPRVPTKEEIVSIYKEAF